MLREKRVWAPHLMPDMPDEFHTAEYQDPERFRHHSSVGPQKKVQKRRASAYSAFMSSSPMFSNNAGAPPPTPTYANPGYPMNLPQDGNSSRSTSAYSTLSRSGMPLSVANGMVHFAATLPAPAPYPSDQHGLLPNGRPANDTNMEVRIPSDQLQKVVDLLQRRASGSIMAPPPLPAHIMDTKVDVEKLEEAAATTEHPDGEGNMMIDRRGTSRSNFSDVSMHAGCPDFPRCTTEDEDSRIVHQPGSGVAPAAVMRSRKEGSADHAGQFTNAVTSGGHTDCYKLDRDFMSTVINQAELEDPDEMQTEQSGEHGGRTASSGSAAGTSKKRTRASMRTLSVNEAGSPEKRDSEMDVDDKPGRKVCISSPVYWIRRSANVTLICFSSAPQACHGWRRRGRLAFDFFSLFAAFAHEMCSAWTSHGAP